ncbi:arabinosyltransferase domain-containing protein [Actinomycetospora sp. NBC_00405]|uniref:arabinosyltransferase domain-containing protein n=1 Tax=Actinomycetospora sp. NBC_00405 TaxID=2975952 RepID=UPI002E1BB53C
MSTEAPPEVYAEADDVAARPGPRPARPWSSVVAVVAGLVALVGAVLLPIAPVSMSVPEVRWPADPRDPAPTMLMLTAYEPIDIEARFSCRAARAAAATPDGVVLSTMGPTSPDADAEALTVRARDGGVTVRSGGEDLYAGPLPAGDCRVVVGGDAAAMHVVVDGVTVSTTPSRMPEPDPDVLPESEPDLAPIAALPEVDALRTSLPALPDATPDDLSVRMTVDNVFDHSPAPLKWALIGTILAALAVGAVAMTVTAVRRPRTDRRPAETGALARWIALVGGRMRRLRPRVVDALVPATLLAWLFLAPLTDDDGYYSAMAANVPFSGYVPNYYQLDNQGFTPFSWPYYALSWWQETFGMAPTVLRIPALVLGLGTWFLVRSFVARTRLLGEGTRQGRWAHAAARLAAAAAFLAWWLPYDMGVRPEPVVAFFALATLVAVVEGIERRRPALVGLAVGIGSAGLMAAPTGFVALAPLVAAAPVVWRWFRRGPGGWWAVAGRWVVVLAPAAVGSLLGFGDGAYRDFVRSQEIFAPIQRAGTWYQEITRYEALLTTESHFGSYARRAAVLVCLLMLVWFLVLVVAARARDLVVPFRLPFAGWTAILAFVLLLPTPSAPTHHFGALAGLGAVFLALVLVDGPPLLARLDRERPVPQATLAAAALSAVLVFALAWHGRDMWPYDRGLGMPAYGDFPSVRGIEFDQPLWWALALAGVAVAVAAAAARWAPGWRRLALGVATPVLAVVFLLTFTVWMVGDFARAAVLTSSTWSPQVDAWNDPGATRSGMAHQIDVLDPGSAQALPPATPPATAAGTEAFVAGAYLPTSPPPPGLEPDVPVFGSFLVPAPGANADSRRGTFITDWYRLPPSSPDAGLAVSVSGRLGDGVSLRAEYGRADPSGFVPVGERLIGDPDSSVEWRTVPLVDEAAPPPGAEVVRLVAVDDSTTTGGWLAFTGPTVRRWVPLPEFLPADRAVGVAWQMKSLFPGVRQPRQQAGITEPAAAAIAYGETPRNALADWTFEPERGGLLGHTHREADVTRLTTRFRDAGDEVDDLWVLEYRQPYPSDGFELIRRRETVSGLP